MALRLRWWVLSPAAAALLAVVVLLPPREPAPDRVSFWYSFFGPGRVYSSRSVGRSPFRADVQEAMRVQAQRLRHAALADSILTAARGPHALRSADGAVTIVYERPLTADSARFWLGAVARELDGYPAAPVAGMPLVVALLSDTARDAVRAGNWTVEELLDQAERKHACVATVNLYSRAAWLRATSYVGHDRSGAPATRLLEACGLYARFGMPAAPVAGWAWADASFWYRWLPFSRQLIDARRSVWRSETGRVSRGALEGWTGNVQWSDAGCLRGTASLCLRASGLVARSALPPVVYRSGILPPERFLAYLLATGTPAEFVSFWRSPQPPAEALARVYWSPAGDLALAAVRHWYRAPEPGGPRSEARVVLAAAGWAAFAVAVALAAGRRWTSVS